MLKDVNELSTPQFSGKFFVIAKSSKVKSINIGFGERSSPRSACHRIRFICSYAWGVVPPPLIRTTFLTIDFLEIIWKVKHWQLNFDRSRFLHILSTRLFPAFEQSFRTKKNRKEAQPVVHCQFRRFYSSSSSSSSVSAHWKSVILSPVEQI